MPLNLKPETERLVHDELSLGHFRSVDEIIVQGITAWHEKNAEPGVPSNGQKPNLADFLSDSPLAGSGLDAPRSPDYPRPADL
ncbi:MAG: hypothetical protein J0L64_27870 [Acidobacteria bacterium]|nr:hypothetical protein [Acidobacteriota bacterium]